VVLLNNIDYDHPDFFSTEDDYKNAFIEFIKKIPVRGWLIANYDDPIIRKVAAVNCHGKVISYAIKDTADFVAYDIKASNGLQYFKVKMSLDESGNNEEDFKFTDTDLGQFSIQLAGEHNISNALAVIAASVELGIELFKIRKYLTDFTGTTRRMQVLGEFRGATVIDDYAHHPTEIKATLAAIRQKYGQRKLIVVFHPHTFSRTKALLDDFASSFNLADELIVLDIYGSAREEQGGVHSQDLVEKIRQQITDSRRQTARFAGASARRADSPLRRSFSEASRRQKIRYIPTLAECEKYLRENIERDDLIVLMGAGDVFRIGENLVKV
jgi:UDP-N-acetylmuramate--alanine ligase